MRERNRVIHVLEQNRQYAEQRPAVTDQQEVVCFAVFARDPLDEGDKTRLNVQQAFAAFKTTIPPARLPVEEQAPVIVPVRSTGFTFQDAAIKLSQRIGDLVRRAQLARYDLGGLHRAQERAGIYLGEANVLQPDRKRGGLLATRIRQAVLQTAIRDNVLCVGFAFAVTDEIESHAMIPHQSANQLGRRIRFKVAELERHPQQTPMCAQNRRRRAESSRHRRASARRSARDPSAPSRDSIER
jgi:hypothetical protein